MPRFRCFGSTTERVATSLVVGGVLHAVGVVAGLGYLRQERVRGFIFGNVYGVIGLLSVVVANAVLRNPVVLVAAVYPVLTLVLINARYRRHLIH